MPPPAFTDYPTFTRERLVTRYTQVVFELAAEKSYLGDFKAQETRVKNKAWFEEDQGSTSQRNRAAAFSASEITATIAETEGKIAALTEERFLIEHLIKWGAYQWEDDHAASKRF